MDSILEEATEIYYDRFLSKIHFTDNCWLWDGAKQSIGYGCFWFHGKAEQSHRVSYVLFKGNIPPEIKVLHKCDVRSCVNPDHLFLGTQKDNVQDMANKGRHFKQKNTHCPNGHEYSTENTHIQSNKARVCKTCRKEWWRRAREKSKSNYG